MTSTLSAPKMGITRQQRRADIARADRFHQRAPADVGVGIAAGLQPVQAGLGFKEHQRLGFHRLRLGQNGLIVLLIIIGILLGFAFAVEGFPSSVTLSACFPPA